ncbi:Tol-Pal system beta propeller repeat protein TolB [bacterium]|nr:Tol-Pal system beta propeller repeat protein TolB [candidate division CSSED10-310 bacterium]
MKDGTWADRGGRHGVGSRLTPLLAACILVSWIAAPVAAVDVYLDIKSSGSRRIDVAVPRFSTGEESIRALETGEQIRSILMYDLLNSSVFNPIDISPFFASEGVEASSINFKQWYLIGMQALVAGTFTFHGDEIILKAWIYDVPMGQEIIGKSYQGQIAQLREMVHRLSDEMVFRFTGEQGVARTRIAFVKAVAGIKEIMLMDYDGHNMIPITSDGTLSLFPALTGDGTRLAYTSYRHGNPDLLLIELRDKTVSTLASGGMNITPAFDAAGTHLAFSREIDGNPEICTMDLMGSNLQRLTFYPGIDSSPDWSPNGRQLVFTSDRSGSPQLWTMDVEGGNQRRLTFIGEYNDGAAWSPRGDRIAFHSRQNGAFEICLINPDGSHFTQVTNDLGSCETPAWSPDGRQLIFSVRKGGTTTLMRLQLQTGRLSDIGTPGRNEDWTAPCWSR